MTLKLEDWMGRAQKARVPRAKSVNVLDIGIATQYIFMASHGLPVSVFLVRWSSSSEIVYLWLCSVTLVYRNISFIIM